MAQGMRIRASAKEGITEVKALMNHPMETGQRKDAKTGELVPAHFIEEVICQHNGKQVMRAVWSGGVSKNPYLAFKFKGGAAGDKVQLSWKDNQGGSESAEAEIK